MISFTEVVTDLPEQRQFYGFGGVPCLPEGKFDDFSVQVAEGPVIQMTDYYPYGMVAENWVREGEQATKELFQGKTFDEETGWNDFHARQYDPALGRWFAMDPQNQFASPYLGMGSNPVMMVDPDGEFVFSAILPGAGIFIDAALWGAVIGGSGYTASVAMSSGGFNNWNWGQFGKSAGMGAVSGVVTAGIGSAFGPVGSQGLAGEIGRAMMHGQANMMVGAAFGQSPSMGSYLTGFASSLAGSSFMMYGGKFANSTAGLYGFSGVAGGLTASATGGDFWQGAAIGLMNAGLNHAKANIDAAGARYFSNKKAFYDHLWKNSFDADGNVIREVSGWELENGDAIALPYDKNHLTSEGGARSYNDGLPVYGKPGKMAVGFKGNKYAIGTHAHTHPLSHWAISNRDVQFINNVMGGKAIHILWNERLFGVKSRTNWVDYGTWK